MAFKLTKQEIAKRDDHVTELEKAWTEIEAAVTAHAEGEAKLREPVEAAVTRYNELLAEAKGFAEDIATRLGSEYEEKTEKWQEGDNGQAASELKDAWESIELEEIEVEWPDSLAIEDPEHCLELSELATEA